ncbi:hypothetical protein [Burkholderia humptydooensis]|uniref:hypothetical protein n=1 Tax=Burkholderia humptydooensis TaxID=430531 RepID=UPI001E5C9F04|nr:hypothetical protein [Burkholderia humptydooensis]
MPVVGVGMVFDRPQHRCRVECARILERDRLARLRRVSSGCAIEMRGRFACAVEQGFDSRVPVGQRRCGRLARADDPFVLFKTTSNQLSFVFSIGPGVVHSRVPSQKNATTKFGSDNGCVVVFIIGNEN